MMRCIECAGVNERQGEAKSSVNSSMTIFDTVEL